MVNSSVEHIFFRFFFVVVVAETRSRPGISTPPLKPDRESLNPSTSTTTTMSPIATNRVGDVEKDPMLAELGTTNQDGTNEKKRRNTFILALIPLLGTLFLLTTFRSTCWSFSDTTTTLTSPNDPSGPGPVFIPNGLRPAVHSRSPQTAAVPAPTSSAPAPQRTVLQCFEVDQPVLLPDGAAESDGSSHEGKTWNDEDACTVLLMRRDFAWSYEDPFIGRFPFPFRLPLNGKDTDTSPQPNTPHPPAPSTASSSTSPPSPKGVNTTGSPSWYLPPPLPPPHPLPI